MKIVIYGLGKQAEMVHYLFTHDSPHQVAAFCVDAAYLPAENTLFSGLPVVSFEDLTAHYPATDYGLHIAVGQVKARQRIYETAKAWGYSFASYISSKARIWPDLITGEHVFIDQVMDIHPCVSVGNNTMLIGCRIGHHTRIGDHVLMSGVTVGGGATVGDNTFIGMGTVVNEGISIGQNNIIGSGCLISRSTADYAVFSGAASKPRAVDAKRIALFRK